ncbi:MAG: ABC transporter ATP-binding protein [Chloroflexi bacterium]|nr:ABC transporter ATP-binding protein [Chloroflexota bacterium]
MNDQAPVIDVRDVVKTFDKGLTRALDGVTLSIDKGEFVSITGPSGCGKSTLLHAIAALEKPDSGEIYINGEEITSKRDLSRYRARTIGLVFQLHNLLPNLSASENVQVPMYEISISPRERRKRADELLGLVSLQGKEKKRPTQLSGGERQRVAVARALSNGPPIILADEPTGNLDSKASLQVIELLKNIQREQGVTLVLVTHNASIAEAADRAVHMLDGRIESKAED